MSAVIRATWQSLVSAMTGITGSASLANQMPRLEGTPNVAQDRDLYAILRTLAYGNGAYRDIKQLAWEQGVATVDTRGLRNPTNGVNQFYAATMWPGSLPGALTVATPDDLPDPRKAALTTAIERVWQWSQWGTRKQPFAYWLAGLGVQWTKIATKSDATGQVNRVFFQPIEPEYVSDFDTDERGFVIFIRLDIPQIRRDSQGHVERYTHVEMWHKGDGTYRVWERPATAVDPDELGRLVVDLPMEQFGVDFIPFTQAKFRDDGSSLGVAAVLPALDKIVELDAMATRLHQLLFRHNKPDKQIVGAVLDADGVPMRPPDFDDGDETEVRIGDETFYRPPSGFRIENLIADINYTAHLDAIAAHYEALKRTDLPELSWYDTSDGSVNLSGRAIEYKMGPAKARLDEARGNADAALVQANQMALTVAQNNNLPGFERDTIGVFGLGDFEHWFADRPFVPPTPEDTVELEQARATVFATFTGAGVAVRGAAEVAGYTEEEQAALEQADLAIVSPVVPGVGQ